MNHITHTSIKGFQSHVDTEIDFTEGVNIVTGPTNSGKSALIRAVKWVLRNEPRGDAFINHQFARDNKPCEVALHFSNGVIITRTKGPSGNQYKIEEEGKKDAVFSGFGTEIPVEVIAAHGIDIVDFGEGIKLDLNFGGQLDAPFLLSDSPRTAAVVFGKLIGLDTTDAATRLTSKQKRRYLTEVGTVKERVEELKGFLQELPDVERAQIVLADVTIKSRELEEGEYVTRTLRKWVCDYQEVCYDIEYITRKLEIITKSLADAETNITQLSEKGTLCTKLRSMQSELTEHLYESVRLERTIEPLVEKVNTTELAIRDIEMWTAEKEALTQFMGDFAEAKAGLETVQTKLITGQSEVAVHRQHLDELVSSMDICPFSGGELYEACKNLLREVEE